MNADAIYKQGMDLYYKHNKPEAINLLECAAKAGHTGAMLMLGTHYLELVDYEKANVYFEAGAALKEHSCLYFLADAYGRGKGKPIDHAKAYEVIQEAIKYGETVEPAVLKLYEEEAKKSSKKGFFKWLRG